MILQDAVLNTTIDFLRMFSFASISIAFMCDLYQTREAVFSKKLLFYGILIGGLAFYNVALDEGKELFNIMREESVKEIDEYLKRCSQAVIVNAEGWFDSLIMQLQRAVFKLFIDATRGLRIISDFIQEFIIVLLKVLAPVVFGIAAWHVYRGILQQFILYTLATAMWSVGYCIADIAILKTLGLFTIPAALKASGTVIIGGGSTLTVLITFIIVFFLATCVFYILTPFLIFKVLSGSNPAEAINSNMRTAAMTSMAGVGGAYSASKGIMSRRGSGNSGGSGGQISSSVNTTPSSSSGSPNRAPMASDRIRARMREMQQKQRQRQRQRQGK